MLGLITRVYGNCGVGCISGFNNPNNYMHNLTERNLVANGIGYSITGFVQSDRCERVYKHIADNYNIVFQSPVKHNNNSGRKFFFIIFTKKD